jgi:hypothetical protein
VTTKGQNLKISFDRIHFSNFNLKKAKKIDSLSLSSALEVLDLEPAWSTLERSSNLLRAPRRK